MFDQLGNFVDSSDERLDIHLGRLTLEPPTVRGMNGNQFSPTNPEIRMLVPQGSLLPTDTLWVKWQGATAVPEGSHTSPARLVSAGLEFAVPRSVLAYSLGQQIKCTYFTERDGKPIESAALLLDILPLPATALITPKIVEADTNNFLDITALGTKDATIHALLHTLIEAEQPCWLRLEGKKADGTAHNLTVWEGLPARVNSVWINQGFWPQTLANSYLLELGHDTTLTIKYLVAMDKSNIEANAVKFPDRVYTVKAVELVVPTLEEVLDSNGEKVLQDGWTVSTELTLSGKASLGLEVEIFDDDGSTILSKGPATADPVSGRWTHEISVDEGQHRLFARSLYHSGEVDSGDWSLTVVAEMIVDITPVVLSGRNFTIDLEIIKWELTGKDLSGTALQRSAMGGLPPYTYTSDNITVASVDGDGTIRSQGNGAAMISVSDQSGQTKQIAVHVSNVRQLACSASVMTTDQANLWMKNINGSPCPAAYGDDDLVQRLNLKYHIKPTSESGTPQRHFLPGFIVTTSPHTYYIYLTSPPDGHFNAPLRYSSVPSTTIGYPLCFKD